MDDTPYWPTPFRTAGERTRFWALVQDELARLGLEYSGTPPELTTAAGNALYLHNLALRCAGLPHRKWAAAVSQFLCNVAYLDSLTDVGAVSPDVARASFRLRLTPTPGDDKPPSQHDEAGVLRRPALPGTDWLLQLALPGAAMGVTAELLKGWSICADEAFELARVNAVTAQVPRLLRKGVVRVAADPSMFTHQAVLRPQAFISDAPAGWFVAVPSREHALVVRADGTDAGLLAMTQLVRRALEVMASSGYPLSHSPWYVPPSGLGQFGEQAEAIGLEFSRFDGSIQRVRMGPQVHALFGETC